MMAKLQAVAWGDIVATFGDTFIVRHYDTPKSTYLLF